MRELTLEHLAPYLPYALTGYFYFQGKKKTGIWRLANLSGSASIQLIKSTKTTVTSECQRPIHEFKPILRTLSDLYHTDGFSMSDMISHGYHNTFWGKDKFSVKHIYYHDLLILLKHHFDVFGLIEAGLAIDINTISHA